MTDDNRHVIRTRPLSAWNAFAVLHADAYHRLGCSNLGLQDFGDVIYAAFALDIVERADVDTWRVVDIEAWEELLLATDARLRLASR